MKKNLSTAKRRRIIMKITFIQFLLVFLFSGVSWAETNAQEMLNKRISLEMEHAELETVINRISKTSHVRISFNSRVIPKKTRVSVRYQNERLSDVLAELLAPLNVTYIVIDNQIILRKARPSEVKKEEMAPETELVIPERRIDGSVRDEKGEPLPGVNVILKGTQNGTITDIDGIFSITIPDGPAALVFSYVGFLTQEVIMGSQSTLDLVLKADTKSLNEVVVVGYGTQQKEDITGAISTVSSKDLKDAPVAQVSQMLQGKLNGVRIDQVSGRPGEGMNIKVRGAVSITAGSSPLYVIDGVPISGDINSINPAEIESISVLKDAASASLYGSRAGNGVVLIQTKSAVPGKTRIDFNSYYGFERVPAARKLKMMNAEQYAQFQKEVAELNGRTPNAAFQNPSEYANKGTDWFDAVTRTGAIQSYNLTVASGAKNFSSAVTAGYFKQQGVVEGTGFQRVSLRVNSVFTPSDKFKIGFNIAPNFSNNSNFATDGAPYGSENIVSAALATTPLASPYNPDGTLAMTASDPATFGNPNWLRVAREKVYENKNLQLLTNVYAEYTILKGLTAKTTANVQLGYGSVFQFNPSTIGVMFNPPPRIPSGSENRSQIYNWLNENSLTYQKEIGDHSFDILGNFTLQRVRWDGNGITATNYADDKIQAVSAAGRQVVTADVQEWALMSYLGRVNYSFRNKYLLTASIRRDGSSRFGPNNRWGNFPSASVGWILSKESFWNVKPVSFFKIRASYGVTGNFEIGNYTFRSTVGSVYYPFNNGLYQGRAANNLGDNNLGWEKKIQGNIGADIYFFDDRFQLTYNFYSSRSSDLLFNVAIPRSSGFGNIQTNIGEMKLWGHEIGLNTYNIRRNGFTWNTNFNISFDRNKVLRLSTEKTDALYHGMENYGFFSHISKVGHPIGLFYGAIQDGVYKNQEDFDASPKHADSRVGTIKFRDLNGDGKITFPEDYTTIGNPWPDFIFGMVNQISYKNFDLSLLLTGSKGNDILTQYENWTTNLDGVFNVLEEVKDRWKSPEDPGAGKYGSTEQGTTYLERDRWNSRFIKDGSFISVKNITVGYTVPLPNKGIRTLRVYGSIQNAWLFTKYPGTNPEVNTRNSISGSSPGIDENSYPVPRTVSLGLNIGF